MIQLSRDSVLVHQPVVVTSNEGTEIVVRPVVDVLNERPVTVPMERVNGSSQVGWRGQLTLAREGEYWVSVASDRVKLTVQRNDVLSFGREFGIFFGVVVVSVMLMIWFLRRQKRQVIFKESV